MSKGILKQVVVIYSTEGEPVFVCPVEEMTAKDYVDLKRVCEKNQEKILFKKESNKKALNDRIEVLERKIRILKGEE